MRSFLGIVIAASLFSGPICNADLVRTDDMTIMEKLETAINEFLAKNGKFPRNGNAETISDLSAPGIGVGFQSGNISAAGVLLSADGQPFIIVNDLDSWCLIGTVKNDNKTLKEYILIHAAAKSPIAAGITEQVRPVTHGKPGG